MRRWMLLALVGLLAACGALSDSYLSADERTGLTPNARVFQLQGEFNILLAQFGQYSAQPFCLTDTQVACAERDVVLRAEGLVLQANEILTAAGQVARTDAGDIETAAAGARIAVAQLSGYLITEGIAQ